LSEPAISVVMPAYNRAKSIGATIASVLEQDFSDFELLVIDDCSSDRTVEVVASIADPRIRTIRQAENSGPSAARNRGVHEARASLISFIDSDDRFLPHKLGYVHRYFEENPEIEVLIDSFEVIYPRLANRKRTTARTNPDLRDSSAIERAVFDRRVYKATPAISARKQSLIAAGLFAEALRRREDMDLVLRLTRSARVATTSAVLWTKYYTRGSLSAQLDTFIPTVIEICRRHPKYFTEPRFRSGLARDEARHLLQRCVRGQFSLAAEDLRKLREFQGEAETRALITEGFGEILRRLMKRKTKPTAAATP